MQRKLIVIGAGFAGMYAALSAARLRETAGVSPEELQIALVSPEPRLVIRPRLYERNPETLTAPLGEVLDAIDVLFVQGTAESIDPESRRIDVSSADGGSWNLAYDRVVLATGSRLFRPNIPGLAEYGFSVDQLEDAIALDRHLHGLADRPESDARNTVVVAGGGFTGLEVATEIPGRLRAILGDHVKTRVVIVERNNVIAPDMGSGPRAPLSIVPPLNEATTSLARGAKISYVGRSIEYRAGMQSTQKIGAGRTGQTLRRRAAGRTWLQKEQKDSTRQRLLEAAQQHFTESSYATTTVDDIVKDAGVSRTTFYRHFRSRLEIAEALFREAMVPTQAIHQRLAAIEHPNDKQIAAWANALIDHLIAHRSLVRIMREVEAVEPTSDSAQEETHRKLIQLYGRRMPAFRLAASDTPANAEARLRAQLLMLLFDQFFFAVAVRESIDRKIGVKVMIREFRRFIDEVGVMEKPRPRVVR